MRQKTTLRQRLLLEVKKTALATLYFLVGFNLLALMLALLAMTGATGQSSAARTMTSKSTLPGSSAGEAAGSQSVVPRG